MSGGRSLWRENESLRRENDILRQRVADPDAGDYVAGFLDVTARKSTESALRASRELLEEAQRIAHIGSWASGFGPGDSMVWSNECYRIMGIEVGLGLSLEEFLERVHPDDLADIQRKIAEAIEGKAPFDFEHRIVRPDGSVRWLYERAVVERDAVGRAMRFVGTAQDVTDRHLALDALRANEQRYRRIVEGTTEGVWTGDRYANITFLNRPMADILGCTVEEALGRSVFDFFHESSTAEARPRFVERMQGVQKRGEFKLHRRDGTLRWVRVVSDPLYDADGRVDGVIGLVTDITGQRHADEIRARLGAIVESSDDAITSVSLEGVITSWNAGAQKLCQYTPEEAVGMSVTKLLPSGGDFNNQGLLHRIERGESLRVEETHWMRKDGSRVEVAITISPLRDATGKIIGASTIARDLTARRQAEDAPRRTEEQLRQAQRMEAVGRLAGGVAHDFNNLLTIILSYADIVLSELDASNPLRDDVDQIWSAGQRAADLTRQLLAFSRQQVMRPHVLDLHQIVAGMEKMLGGLLGEDIELTLRTTQELGRVLADPGQIEQVVMNMAVNARDAMPTGGRLTIETDNTELDATYAAANPDVVAGRYVMLAILDTGAGMDAATCARVFEPFFTTKDQGKGTGLGLSTVYGIVQQSGGHIALQSKPGRGSTFKIYLPRTDQAVEVLPTLKPAGILRGTETILVVEDEAQLRRVAVTILRKSGYHVLEFSNPGEAILAAKGHPGRIHLLLTDVVMPRMSGPLLARVLRPIRPDMQVLYASGYNREAIAQHGVLDGGTSFLQKPYTPTVLLQKVRGVLDPPLDAMK